MSKTKESNFSSCCFLQKEQFTRKTKERIPNPGKNKKRNKMCMLLLHNAHTVTVVDTFIRTLKALSAVAQHGGLQIGGTATTPLTLLN